MVNKEPGILIAGCVAGERRAQQQLYSQLYGFAMQTAMRYAMNRHEAADIMSSAFVKMFRSLDHFDTSKGSIHAWLKKIIINEAISYIKKRSQFTTIEMETVTEPAIPNEFIQKTDAAALMQMIRKLPPATQAVFMLYAVDGYAHKEIAQQLGISEGTSKWHLSEARKILRQKLQTV